MTTLQLHLHDAYIYISTSLHKQLSGRGEGVDPSAWPLSCITNRFLLESQHRQLGYPRPTSEKERVKESQIPRMRRGDFGRSVDGRERLEPAS